MFSMTLILDLQGFKDDANNFIIKECALISNKTNQLQYWVVSPPFRFNSLSSDKRNEAIWLIKHHHGLNWNIEGVNYNTFIDELKYMCANFDIIYAKGSEKCAFLKCLLNKEVINCDTIGCPTLRKLSSNSTEPRCFYHDNDTTFMCALENVRLLSNWLKCTQIK